MPNPKIDFCESVDCAYSFHFSLMTVFISRTVFAAVAGPIGAVGLCCLVRPLPETKIDFEKSMRANTHFTGEADSDRFPSERAGRALHPFRRTSLKKLNAANAAIFSP